MKPTVVDLFCGAGGFSEGFRRAGFEIIYGLDSWRVACDSFRENHPDAKVDCRDALGVRAEEIPEADVILGGPPCPDFSYANRVNAQPERGMALVEWFLGVVREKHPRFWVMENVPALARQHLPWMRHVILNAADYGVPQTRVRAFFGDFPTLAPTHSKHGTRTLDGGLLRPWVGVGEALGIRGVHFKLGHTRANFKAGRFRGTDQPSLTVEGSGAIGFVAKRYHGRYHEPKFQGLGEPSFTVADLAKGGGRLSLFAPSHTVTATEFKYAPGDRRRGSRSLGRKLTVEECMALQSFQPDYKILGSKADRYKQVGNAVPPLLAQRMAGGMLEAKPMRHPACWLLGLAKQRLGKIEPRLERWGR